MAHIYALVLNGVVVNTILAQPTDPQYAPYTWVDITTYSLIPGIGWTTTDNINFTPAGGQ